jgi:hypothetical protein
MDSGGKDSFAIPQLEKDGNSGSEGTLPDVVKNVDVKNTTFLAGAATGEVTGLGIGLETGVGAGETFAGSAPESAKDGNLIEKEWVQHLEQIVKDTKNNPHRREEEIKNVQADYLRKRLNYVVGEQK